MVLICSLYSKNLQMALSRIRGDEVMETGRKMNQYYNVLITRIHVKEHEKRCKGWKASLFNENTAE